MRIREVSERYGISAFTLRYYEKVGIIPPVPRDAGGQWNYSEQDLYWVEVAQCLRSVGMPLETVAAYVRREKDGCFTLQDKLELFEEQRRAVLAQRAQLDALLELLGEKIGRLHEQMGQKSEE